MLTHTQPIFCGALCEQFFVVEILKNVKEIIKKSLDFRIFLKIKIQAYDFLFEHTLFDRALRRKLAWYIGTRLIPTGQKSFLSASIFGLLKHSF